MCAPILAGPALQSPSPLCLILQTWGVVPVFPALRGLVHPPPTGPPPPRLASAPLARHPKLKLAIRASPWLLLGAHSSAALSGLDHALTGIYRTSISARPSMRASQFCQPSCSRRAPRCCCKSRRLDRPARAACELGRAPRPDADAPLLSIRPLVPSLLMCHSHAHVSSCGRCPSPVRLSSICSVQFGCAWTMSLARAHCRHGSAQ
jgi:hypothetical protein